MNCGRAEIQSDVDARAFALLEYILTYVTGKPFLLNSSRLRSMTTDYETSMERTF